MSGAYFSINPYWQQMSSMNGVLPQKSQINSYFPYIGITNIKNIILQIGLTKDSA